MSEHGFSDHCLWGYHAPALAASSGASSEASYLELSGITVPRIVLVRAKEKMHCDNAQLRAHHELEDYVPLLLPQIMTRNYIKVCDTSSYSHMVLKSPYLMALVQLACKEMTDDGLDRIIGKWVLSLKIIYFLAFTFPQHSVDANPKLECGWFNFSWSFQGTKTFVEILCTWLHDNFSTWEDHSDTSLQKAVVSQKTWRINSEFQKRAFNACCNQLVRCMFICRKLSQTFLFRQETQAEMCSRPIPYL